MTQGNRSFSNKRPPRATRNKPSLVTSPDSELSDDQQEQTAVENTAPVEETAPEPETAKPAAPSPARRLPRFFSTVGKSAQEQEASEEEVVQARIARATRGKQAAKAEVTKAEVEKEEKTRYSAKPVPATRANAPARPASPFKTKYIVGMVVYLLGAQLLGGLLTSAFATYKLDSLIAAFSLFGLPIVIKTSTLAFLFILVALLVLLARLDLIPRSFSALTGTPQQRSGTSNRQGDNGVARTPQPTTRQGVSGSDDDLYQQYQANRRRKK